MKSKRSILTIILIVFAVCFVFLVYQSYKDINEHQDIRVAWTKFVGAKYNINFFINGVNQGLTSPEDAIEKVNTELQEINEAKTMLEPIFYGGDELIYVKNFLEFEYNFTKWDLEQAIIQPNPKEILRTTETQDEIRVETEHMIEESKLDRKFSTNIIITIVLTFMAILSWKFDNLKKRS